jgi:hypothetical protein
MFVRLAPALRGFAFAAVALVSLSCASKPPSGGAGTYRGVLVGTSQIGILEITVAEASSGPLPASGTIELGGTVVSLSGTLDRSNASISLASTDGYQLTGVSRPAYVFGTYSHGAQDAGSFALFLESPSDSPISFFCGSFVDTSTTTTLPSTPLPFAVTVTSPGAALCVTPGFAWFGSMDTTTDTLTCQSSGGLFYGNVNADGGNQWGTGVDDQGDGDYGTWTLAPCGGSAGTDGGVDAGATDGSADDGTAGGATD